VSVVDTLAGLDDVASVSSPLDPANDGQIAPNDHAAIVGFDIRGDADDAGEKIDPILATMDELQKAHPEVSIGQFGDTSANAALEESFGKDLERAGLFSLPLTLAILVVAFGALVAAGIPLLLGLSAVLATLGLTALTSQILPVDDAVSAIVLLVGLAVGVDYSLFYLRREREERAAGRSEQAALEAAAATSGRSVLVSGLTVIVAMAGMFLTGDPTFSSLALATILVVAVAVLGSLTVLPALLSRLGDKVERGRIPFVSRLRRDDSEGRFWGAIVDRVLRRPVLWAAVSGGTLVALAAPALQLQLAAQGP
jgi:RND superfamily putative drug exporter